MLTDILQFQRECRKVDDLRWEENKRHWEEEERKFKQKQKQMDAWSDRNVEKFVAGMTEGLKRGGVKDLADEVNRRKKEEEEWRNRIGLDPRS